MPFVDLTQVDGTYEEIDGERVPRLCTHGPADFEMSTLFVQETENRRHFFPALECRICGGIWILSKFENEFLKAIGEK